jgi:hypothetical protein
MAKTPPKRKTDADEIDAVAAALYAHRYEISNGPWAAFCAKKPDVAAIYVKNAQVAIKAIDEHRNAP